MTDLPQATCHHCGQPIVVEMDGWRHGEPLPLDLSHTCSGDWQCQLCRAVQEIERQREELAELRRLSPNGPRVGRTEFERDTM